MLEFDGTLIFKQTNIIRVQNSIKFYSFSIQTLISLFSFPIFSLKILYHF